MTVVRFFTNRLGLITGFEINGHTGYSSAGEDIVCASVSSVAYMVANTLTEVLHLRTNTQVDGGFMCIKLSTADAAKAQDILKGLELHIKSLSNDYPKNIKVKFGGVRNA